MKTNQTILLVFVAAVLGSIVGPELKSRYDQYQGLKRAEILCKAGAAQVNQYRCSRFQDN